MATTLPVPIQFELPEGWQPAPPDEVGAEGAAFVALHPDERHPGFTANITISGQYRPDDAPLAAIADESIDALARAAGAATLADRSEVGSAEAPGLTQFVRVRQSLGGGAERELTQCQVYLSMRDIDDASKRVVVQLALTATPEQLDEVIGDFQAFVTSIRAERS